MDSISPSPARTTPTGPVDSATARPPDVELESLLKSGNAAIVRVLSKTGEQVYKTTLQSWAKSLFLIVDAPPSRSPAAGTLCDVRFVHEGYACAFLAAMLDYGVYCGRDSWRLRWPDKIRVMAFRKHVRVKTCLDCVLECEAGRYEGTIIDLSMGGCGISFVAPPPKDTACVLAFQFPGGNAIDGVAAKVCSIRREGTDLLAGCKFDEDQEDAKTRVAFYVESLRRGPAAHAPRGLVLIEPDTDLRRKIGGGFIQLGLEVIQVPTVLDGLLSLQTFKTAAILITGAQNDLPTIDFVRLIKTNAKTQSLQVFIYETPESLHETLKEAGAHACFTGAPPCHEIVDAVTIPASQEDHPVTDNP